MADLVWVGAALADAGLVTSHGGNLSLRDGDVIRITRTRAMLGRLTPADVVAVPLRGDDAAPQRSAGASSDLPVHRAIYAAAPEARAVVHAHPVTAAALSLALGEGASFQPVDLEGRLHLDRVPIVGGPHLDAAGAAAPVAAAIAAGRRLVLLAGHGTYAVGASLEEALNWTTSCEASAKMLRDARLFGWQP
ncbi:MAG TPA: class II aldolase/adducin family protein [Egibacteraceae bacterium]